MIESQKEEHTDYHILKTIENDASISQRRLSSQIGINVASVNFALKRLIKKGFVRMVGVNPRRLKYFITPQGLKEKTNMAYRFFGRNFHFYKEVRNDIETRIREVNGDTNNKVAIYGVRELAEVTFMVAMVMKLEFVGFFIEDSKMTGKELFGHNIQKLEVLNNFRPCLLLLTDDLSEHVISSCGLGNINVLNLIDYYKY
ncbi:MAG: hypothetical protein A3G70_03890 [Planctomycetes bacterium RIFCSPLOWO2_12_FULL_39_13]|nr:MAG: hypothetical protein A3G70_03890 [Planctomycetes bacterium RIFCSPLOWO2_12_FULL_39_13]